MRRPPFEPPSVRIEPPAPERPSPPSAGLGNRARIAAAGLAGLVLGFLLAVSLRPDEPTATPVDDAAPVAATSTESPSVELRSGGDELRGELVVVTGRSGGEIVARTVAADGTVSRTTRLVDGLVPATLAWNADRNAVAGLGPGPAGNVLYAGPVDAMVPVTLAASSFAWHTTAPGQIAWTEPRSDGEVLFTGDVLARDFFLVEVGPAAGPVVAWGDWGYLIQSFTTDTEIQLVHDAGTVRAAGSISAVNTRYRTVPVFPDPDRPPEVAILDVIAGGSAALDPGPAAFQVTVAPELRRAAWIVQTGARAAELRVQPFDQPEPAVIPIPPAQLLDWSPDGTLIALQATASRVEEDSVFRPLLVVAVGSGEVHEVRVERGDVLGTTIRTTSP